jgi:hypothetical protein
VDFVGGALMPQGSGTCCKAFVLAESRRQTFLAGGGLARQTFPVRHATELCAEAGGSGWGYVSMVERSGASGLRFLFSVCKGARLDTCQQHEAGDRKPEDAQHDPASNATTTGYFLWIKVNTFLRKAPLGSTVWISTRFGFTGVFNLFPETRR